MGLEAASVGIARPHAKETAVIITPSAFKSAFLSVVMARSERMLAEWRNPTDAMLSPQGGILQEMAKRLHRKYFREYWKLDAIFYEKKDELYFSQDATFAENISVAIEHENPATYTHIEMNKLGLFNTPLGVLITYPGRNAGKLLEQYADILKRSDLFGDFGKKRRKMVVFGKQANRKIQWSFYLFDGR
jgi:hypothetical protein